MSRLASMFAVIGCLSLMACARVEVMAVRLKDPHRVELWTAENRPVVSARARTGGRGETEVATFDYSKAGAWGPATRVAVEDSCAPPAAAAGVRLCRGTDGIHVEGATQLDGHVGLLEGNLVHIAHVDGWSEPPAPPPRDDRRIFVATYFHILPAGAFGLRGGQCGWLSPQRGCVINAAFKVWLVTPADNIVTDR